MEEKKIKRILLNLSKEQHQTIKIRAAQMGISMSLYIYQAIVERFKQDEKLGWK